MASPRARRNKSERESAQDDAERTADRLHSAAIHLLRRLRREDAKSGLSAPRLSALSVLVFGGPLTLGELANAEQVRPPTMTRLVTALEADGRVSPTRAMAASRGFAQRLTGARCYCVAERGASRHSPRKFARSRLTSARCSTPRLRFWKV
jgi:hypothetical protein